MSQNHSFGATIGVFDAGIGGIPFAARLRARAPQHRLVYLADAARRPYGPREAEEVARFTRDAEAFFADAGCDIWVIACNTASVVADRLAGLLPCVHMVDAVRHAAPPPAQGPVGLLATAGTVASGVYPAALPDHQVHQVPVEELLRLAEEGRAEDPRVQDLTRAALTELESHGVATVLLACTDFTCVLEPMRAVAGDVTLIDPIDAAVELTLRGLDHLGPGVGARTGAEQHDRLVLTGPHPCDVATFAREQFKLALPAPQYLPLPNTFPLQTR